MVTGELDQESDAPVMIDAVTRSYAAISTCDAMNKTKETYYAAVWVGWRWCGELRTDARRRLTRLSFVQKVGS